MFQFQPEKARWFSEPRRYEIQPDRVIITTDPGSDFWQRTYYGFQNDNAHVLLNSTKEPYFSFTVKATFKAAPCLINAVWQFIKTAAAGPRLVLSIMMQKSPGLEAW